MKCARNKDLLRYITGSLPSEQAAALDEHLAHCPQCTKTKNELMAATSHLAPDPGEFDEPEIAKNVMTLIRMGRAEPEPTRPSFFRPVWVLVPAAAACLLALVILMAWPQPEAGTEGFHVRGGNEDPDRWVSVRAFRATAEGYQKVGENMKASDALAFSYSNHSETYRHLMVFAVNPEGQVFWYYPAHTEEGVDPNSIAIGKEAKDVPLPDQIRHPLRAGPLRLFALFSPNSLHVSDVETAVARDFAVPNRDLSKFQRLDMANTGQHSILLTVTKDP